MANYIVEDKIGMYEKVQNFGTSYAGKFSNYQALLDSFTSHGQDLANLLSHLGASKTDIRGYTEEKQKNRARLIDIAFHIGQAYTATCNRTGVFSSGKKFDETLSYLNRKRDNDLYVYCKQLYDVVYPIATDLQNHNVSSDLMAEFGTTLSDFFAHLQGPKGQISLRSNAGNNLLLLVPTIDDRLVLMDSMMATFRLQDPSLYNLYLSARSIDQSGGGSPVEPDYQGLLTETVPQLVATLPYKSNRSFKVRNDGPGTLEWGISSLGDFIEYNRKLAPGSESNLLSSTLGPLGQNLMVRCRDANTRCDYKIWVTE